MNASFCRRIGLVSVSFAIAACAGGGGGGGDDGSGSGNGNGQIDLFKVGQQSRYAVALGTRFASSPYSYVQGVLVVEIIAQDDIGYRVREAFASPGEVDPRVASDPTIACEYYFRVQGSELHVLGAEGRLNSRIFFWSNDRSLPLGDIAEPVIEISGLETTASVGAGYTEAAVLDATLRGMTYPHLNAVVDNTAIPVDGPASTWLYDATHGVVRAAHCAQASTCIAFDRIPE